MDNGLSRNDLLDDMHTAQDDIRPDIDGDTDEATTSKSDHSRVAAADRLSEAEQNAGSDLSRASDGLGGARKSESVAGGFYSGTGKSSPIANAKKKILIKRGGPIIAIILSFFGIGGSLLGTQVFMPFSLVAQFEETFNSMHTSADLRSAVFFRKQMETGRVKRPIKGNKIFGYKFTISDKQKQRLAEQGIEFDENYEGKKVLKYTDSNGDLKIVTADNFKSIYSSDIGFFKSYNAGSMTWRGAIANWFGTNTTNFLKNNRLTRNMFEKYKEEVESGKKNKQKPMEVLKKIIGDRTKVPDGDMEVKIAKEDATSEESSIGRTVNSEAEVRAKLTDISSKFNSGANAACAVVGTIGAISLLVSANEALQVINLTTAYFESVDKTKAGYGDESPINELTTALVDRKQNRNVVVEGSGDGTYSENGVNGMRTVAVTTEKTAMESAGIGALYGGGRVDPYDPSVRSFNLTSSMESIVGGVGTSMDAFKGCMVAKMGAAAISAGLDTAAVVACVAGLLTAVPTAGVGLAAGCGPLAISIGSGVLLGISIATVLSGVVALITPAVSNMLMRDLVTELGGENLGNALTSGANMYQGGTHRANGGSLSSIGEYKQFALEQQRVIAEKAKDERERLSPFDITSKYTFMGTILTPLMNFAHSNSLTSTLLASGNAVSSSLLALSPSAQAYDIAEYLPDDIDEYWETCPYLASIGAIGDSFCNPYVITDTSTIDDDPEDVIAKVDSYGGLGEDDSEGNVTIDPDSDLAKYIRYCDNRSSSFGVADQNIAGEVGSTGATGSSVIDGGIGGIPVIGDAVDIIQSSEQLSNLGYISGESCVAGNKVDAASSPNWKKAKYYQRFIEDQSLAESMGIIDKSAVTAYLDDYYEKNPLDNSYEGILARYSGLDKETVASILDIIEYENYIADYDPTTRYAFEGTKSNNENIVIDFDSENVLSGDGILLGTIIYNDIRNRSFAI